MSLEPKPELTDAGNPAKPEGAAGTKMLHYMNEEHADLTEWGLGLLHYSGEERILDIGCGGGATLRRLSGLAPEGTFFGVDYSETSVALSRETNGDLIAAGKMEIRSGAVQSLPYSDASFTKAVTVESFYFWEDPVKSLSEVRRVLKEGGVFLLISEIYERDDLTEHIRDNIRKYHMNVPGKEEFLRLFREAGFTETVLHTKEGEFWIAVEGRKTA